MVHPAPCRRIILCGPSAQTPPLLGRLLRRSANQALEVVSSSAFSTEFAADRTVVTTAAGDLLGLKKIRSWSDQERAETRVVICVRDPRDSLIEKDGNSEAPYKIGYDHALHVARKIVTLASPGLVFQHGVAEATARQAVGVLLLRHEDILRRPHLTQLALASFTGLDLRKGFAGLLNHEQDAATAGFREQQASGSLTPRDARRVARQFRLAPGLFNILETHDYEMPGDRRWFDLLREQAPHAFDDTPGTIVGFHTADELYVEEARRMKVSIEALGLPLALTAIEPRDWLASVQCKPAFLLEERKRLRGPLLYIDVDAVVHADPWPYLRGYDSDVALAGHQGEAIISGTVLINDTSGAVHFLEEWVAEQAKSPKLWDQHCLEKIAKRHRHGADGVVVDYLPPELCCVFNRKFSPPIIPLIEHLQASRERFHDSEDDKKKQNLSARRNRLAQLDQAKSERDIQAAYSAKTAQERAAETRSMMDSGASDTLRWAQSSNLKSAWRSRAAVVAGLIPAETLVLDLGCGAMDLEHELATGTTYLPADLVARDCRTIIVDLNGDDMPSVEADVVTMLGVLEYIHQPERLLAAMAKRWPRAIITYNPTDLDHGRDRRTHGWFNDMTSAQLISNADSAGYRLVGVVPHGPRERVYEFSVR